jgi:hypothetical protein
MPRAVGLRWVAWSGAVLGALLIVVSWLATPAVGSNYAEELAAEARRLEVGMWVGAGIGIGFPAIIWFLQAACRGFGLSRGNPASMPNPALVRFGSRFLSCDSIVQGRGPLSPPVPSGGVMADRARWTTWNCFLVCAIGRFTTVGKADSTAASCERRTGTPEP